MRRKSKKNVALLAAMARANLTGRELARQTGYSTVTISRTLNSHSAPRNVTANAIAAVLHLTPSELGLPDLADIRKGGAL